MLSMAFTDTDRLNFILEERVEVWNSGNLQDGPKYFCIWKASGWVQAKTYPTPRKAIDGAMRIHYDEINRDKSKIVLEDHSNALSPSMGSDVVNWPPNSQ